VVGIAEVVALLVSDRGKFLTGANYGVDGGMTAR
jgi:NAD(P)-dependent dehydrogenase (short-subunit alcohol dehydrogenase family)